ncbi:MAG: hypothetical protein AUJ49_00410 [Desulfovibrionaceae bacterium CG1_02_65_16]|nr:MAG: hypothetical protein AUJ49_00410 [Desulfovibrionaceae bacterium CG1_02_65_16]
MTPGWALWFTGLPGCGKSTIARAVRGELAARGVAVEYFSMDERRKSYFLHPDYSAEERARSYTLFAEEAAGLTAAGRNVILDATAYRLAMRQEARERIARFAEVLVRCPLPEAMRREAVRSMQAAHGPQHKGYVMPGMYQKALERRRTGVAVPGLGQVVGVDVPYEENPDAECVLDALRPVEENARRVLEFLDGWLPGLPPEDEDAA